MNIKSLSTTAAYQQHKHTTISKDAFQRKLLRFYSQEHKRNHSEQLERQQTDRSNMQRRFHFKQMFHENGGRCLEEDRCSGNFMIRNHQFIPLSMNRMNRATIYIALKQRHNQYRNRKVQEGRNFCVERVRLTKRDYKSQQKGKKSQTKIENYISPFGQGDNYGLKERSNNTIQTIADNLCLQTETRKADNKHKQISNKSKQKQNKTFSIGPNNESQIKWHKPQYKNKLMIIS